MKFGHEYEKALANEGFPAEWLPSAIDYKFLKKCIKKVHRELRDIGLDAGTLHHLTESLSDRNAPHPSALPEHHDYYSAAEPHLATISEEFCPQLRVLVDSRTGTPLDAHLAPETKASLRRLAQSSVVLAGRREHLGGPVQPPTSEVTDDMMEPEAAHEAGASSDETSQTAKWVSVPLASAKDFFDILAPKLEELEHLREAETLKLEDEILALGEAIENVVEPVRDGYEARRRVSYRDLYFWREMFRLYLENPVFYSQTEQNHGALTFTEARRRLEAYDTQLRATGLLAKMKTPEAREAARQFLDINVDILRIMHFQEMNARAMSKILKKFDKQTSLDGNKPFLLALRQKYPDLLAPTASTKAITNRTASGFATSIARDLHAEIASKVLSIVPQLDDWTCPVCTSMAWRPVNLGCCRAVFCIRCVIKLQDEGMARCPMCNADTVMAADGRRIDFEAVDFLEKYFPLEVKRRQRENEKADLVRTYGEEFVKPGCGVM